ncbi:hypothetical protein C0991_000258 [Blastosporella zonata]|nr:hypothetical protein C0991_000258 [Blastosporella zonata]
MGPAPAHDTTRIESPYTVESVITTPGAPVMKDLDSFTDGTGAGSFPDFFPEDADEEFTPAALVAHPNCGPYNPFIQAWRMDVSASNAPLVSIADLPEDPLETEALESTEALLEEFVIAESEKPEHVYGGDNEDVGGGTRMALVPPSNPPPPMSTPVAMTPRAMKRARSRSPASQSPRHVRSRSLLSIAGFPSDLTALPPWRLSPI